MWKWIDKFFDRAFAVLGAFVFSQAPEFFQQYTQRLSGHVAELKHYVLEMEQMAALTGKALPQYLAKFLSSSDPDFASQGKLMEQMINRYQDLQVSLTSMQEANAFTRPFAFFAHFQPDIAGAACMDFKPALALTAEGISYAVVGLVAGYYFYALLKFSVRLFSSKKTQEIHQ